MKKLLALLLTFVLMFSFVPVTAFAAETQTGTITISNPAKGTKYNVYRIFDIQSHSDNYDSVAYRVSKKWQKFLPFWYRYVYNRTTIY